MIPRLTFRCAILVFLSILLIQIIILLNIYLNIVPYDKIIDLKNNVSQLVLPKIFSNFEERPNLFYSCDITDSQAILALKRMKTFECKQKCIDVYCKITRSKPWPDFLPSKCHNFDANKVGHLHSCYEFNDDMLSLFSNKKHNILNDTSRNDCMNLCLQTDFEFAARYLNHCICTNSLEGIKQDNAISCDMCSNTQCSKQLSVFQTGLKKLPFYFPNKINETKTLHTPKILFLLLINGRALLQVNRLLRNIYSTHHYYYIHVDLRHNYLYKELLLLERRFSNIRVARNRFASIWGGSSLLTTILSCIKDVLIAPHFNDWDFIINLSETDFPIKPVGDFERYLEGNMGKNFLKSHGKNTYDFIKMQAMNKVFIECEQRMWRIANRDLVQGIVWDGGSDWIILNRNFSHYLIYSEDQLLQSLKYYFEYSLLPAESFFHVVLRNSQFCETIVNNNLRVTNWNRKRGCKCQHKNIVDWCGCSPNTFRNKDTSRLFSTQAKAFFFARKFEHIVDSEIIDFVEQSLLMNGLPLLEESAYFENLFSFEHDNISILSEAMLEFYSNHGKSLSNLIYQKCDFEQIQFNVLLEEFKFLESNVYFKNNKFFGLLLKYAVFQNSTPASTFEIIMKKYPNDTLILSNEFKPKLRSIKVCHNFDVKEEMFRDFECVIDQYTNLEISHVWELFFGQYNLTFIFLDPNNRIHSRFEVIINNTKSDEEYITQLFRPQFPYLPLLSGMWKLLVLNQGQIVSASKFIVMPTTFSNIKTSPAIDSDHNPLSPKLHSHEKNVILLFIEQHQSFFDASNNLFWYIHAVCFEVQPSEFSFECGDPLITACSKANWNLNTIRSRYIF